MSRINTNVNSLVAQRILNNNNKALSTSLERLSTGLRINRAKDDPGGLIASENLRADKAAITAALGNAERADQVVGTAEAGLGEIQTLLTELDGLVTATANESGLTQEEKEANQAQVDNILQSIDRIASTTSFSGAKLLNGTMDFRVGSVAATVASYRVNGAMMESGASVAVNAVVTASAQHAGLYVSTGGALDLANATDQFTIEVGGTNGSRDFSFASGTTVAQMITAINQFKSYTGVSAAASGTGMVLKTADYGSSQFVSFNITNRAGQTGNVYQLSATNENEAKTASATAFAAVNGAIRDTGQDVTALVNGIKAQGDGKNLAVRSDGLDVDIELTTAGATATGAISALTITGGGATFNLGPRVEAGNLVRIGLGKVGTDDLGNVDKGRLSTLKGGGTNSLLSANLDTAQQIVRLAINQVGAVRSKLGSFQSGLTSTMNNLSVALENTSAAESAIRDTDFAAETASMTRSQILVAAGNSVLGIANSQPTSVLGLIG